MSQLKPKNSNPNNLLLVVGFEPSNELEQAIFKYMTLIAFRKNDHWVDHPAWFQVEISKGKKYYRIINTETWKATNQSGISRSVHSFVDQEGNIYKSAGWKSPSKYIRGNVFDLCGINAITQDGYLKSGR